MKITKYFSVIVLVLLGLLLTTFTFAYWAKDINGSNINLEGNTIQIGEAGVVDTTLELVKQNETNKSLVPKGYVRNESETDTYTFIYQVNWKEPTNATDNEVIKGKLRISDAKIKVKNISTENGLFHLDFDESNKDIILNGDPVEIVFTVSFKHAPKSKAEYDAIKGQILELQATFNVTKETTK